MVNNTGIAIGDVNGLASKPGGRRVHEVDSSMFDLTMSINTRSVFLDCKYALAQFLSQEPLAEIAEAIEREVGSSMLPAPEVSPP